MIALFGSDTILGEEISALIGSSRDMVCESSSFNTVGAESVAGRLDDVKPSLVINCREFSDMVRAEHDRGEAYGINALAVKNMAELCRDRGIILVQVSTSYIFSGEGSRPFREDDAPGPLSVYGDSKLLGERYLADSGCRHLIVRLPDMYSRRDSFLQGILGRARKSGVVNLVRGQYLAPVSAGEAAKGIRELINRGAEGLYHYGPSGMATAREFVQEALDIYRGLAGETSSWTVNEQDYREFPIAADRPLFNVLDKSKYEKYTGIHTGEWRESLKQFMKDQGERL